MTWDLLHSSQLWPVGISRKACKLKCATNCCLFPVCLLHNSTPYALTPQNQDTLLTQLENLLQLRKFKSCSLKAWNQNTYISCQTSWNLKLHTGTRVSHKWNFIQTRHFQKRWTIQMGSLYYLRKLTIVSQILNLSLAPVVALRPIGRLKSTIFHQHHINISFGHTDVCLQP